MPNIKHFNEVFDLLDHGGLLWKVDHEPLDHDRYRVVRRDNGKRLGSSSIPAPPLQNSHFIDVVKKVAQHLDLQTDRAGYLLAGQYVFVRLPLEPEDIAGEKITCSLNIRMQHAGQRSITVGVTDRFANNLIIHHDHRQCSSVDLSVIGLSRNVLRAMQLHNRVITTYQRMYDTETSEDMAARALLPAIREGMGIKDPLHPRDHEVEWIQALESDLQDAIVRSDNVLGVLKGFMRYSNRGIHPSTSAMENHLVLRNRVARHAYLYLRQWVNQKDLMSFHSLS